MSKSTIMAARSAIGRLTPAQGDCGKLCGAACCAPDDEGKGGVYLFPGEEALLKDVSWGTVTDTDFAPMLVCRGPCVRSMRPIACRIFPLTPVPNGSGWSAAVDTRARPICPLALRLGDLRPDFVRGVRSAIRILASDPDTEAFLRRWAGLEGRYRDQLEELLK